MSPEQTREASPCPHLRKGRHAWDRWVREANEKCDHPDHRYSDAMHIPVDLELERIRRER